MAYKVSPYPGVTDDYNGGIYLGSQTAHVHAAYAAIGEIKPGFSANVLAEPTNSAIVTLPVADTNDPTSFGGTYYAWYMGGAGFVGVDGYTLLVRRSPGFSLADAVAGETYFYVGVIPADGGGLIDPSANPQSATGRFYLENLPDAQFVQVADTWDTGDFSVAAFPHGVYVVIGLWNFAGPNAAGLDVLVDADGLTVGATSPDGGSTFTPITTPGQIPYATIFGGEYLDIQTSARLRGGLQTALVTVTADYVATRTDSVIVVNAASKTVTLPARAERAGRVYTVINGPSGASTTVATAAGTINGASTDTSLAAAYAHQSYVSDGTNWLKSG